MAVPTTPTIPVVGPKAIEPAPPVKDRPARPKKRPEIKLSPRVEESRFIGPLPLAIGLIGLAVAFGFAQRIISQTDDPNYVRATESLGQYELGRPELERNYDDPVYTEALSSLERVDSGSISAEKAAALSQDIKTKSELFHRRINARAQDERKLVDQRADREKEFEEARQRDMLVRKKDYPECREGNHEHAH